MGMQYMKLMRNVQEKKKTRIMGKKGGEEEAFSGLLFPGKGEARAEKPGSDDHSLQFF